MSIPESIPAAVTDAMQHFDQELRDTTHRLNWEDDTTHKYAINYNERLYPVKQIVSIATGTSIHDFSGSDEANRYAEGVGFTVIDLRPEKASWIFQSNPKYYDVLGAMQNLKELTWLVIQQKSKIHAGNRVFLWEAGENAGIVGIATIMTEPAEMEEKEDQKLYAKDPSKFEGSQTRVILRPDRIVSPRLPRKDLLQDEILRTLGVLGRKCKLCGVRKCGLD
jgi:EVE domain